MSDVTNKDRAGWAGIAHLEYAIGKEGKGGLYETPETVLTDLLCDMRHYADLKGFDFGTCNARAASLYGEEEDEEIGNQFWPAVS